VQIRLYLASADCVAPHKNYDGSLQLLRDVKLPTWRTSEHSPLVIRSWMFLGSCLGPGTGYPGSIPDGVIGIFH